MVLPAFKLPWLKTTPMVLYCMSIAKKNLHCRFFNTACTILVVWHLHTITTAWTHFWTIVDPPTYTLLSPLVWNVKYCNSNTRIEQTFSASSNATRFGRKRQFFKKVLRLHSATEQQKYVYTVFTITTTVLFNLKYIHILVICKSFPRLMGR